MTSGADLFRGQPSNAMLRECLRQAELAHGKGPALVGLQTMRNQRMAWYGIADHDLRGEIDSALCQWKLPTGDTGNG